MRRPAFPRAAQGSRYTLPSDAAVGRATMTEVVRFGANPGDLRMKLFLPESLCADAPLEDTGRSTGDRDAPDIQHGTRYASSAERDRRERHAGTLPAGRGRVVQPGGPPALGHRRGRHGRCSCAKGLIERRAGNAPNGKDPSNAASAQGRRDHRHREGAAFGRPAEITWPVRGERSSPGPVCSLPFPRLRTRPATATRRG